MPYAFACASNPRLYKYAMRQQNLSPVDAMIKAYSMMKAERRLILLKDLIDQDFKLRNIISHPGKISNDTEKLRMEEIRCRFNIIPENNHQTSQIWKMQESLLSSRGLLDISERVYREEFERDHPGNRDCPEREELFILHKAERRLCTALRDWLTVVIKDTLLFASARHANELQRRKILHVMGLLQVPDDVAMALWIKEQRTSSTQILELPGPYPEGILEEPLGADLVTSDDENTEHIPPGEVEKDNVDGDEEEEDDDDESLDVDRQDIFESVEDMLSYEHQETDRDQQ
eukprot:gene10248-2404_t